MSDLLAMHDRPADKTTATHPALADLGIAPRLLTREQAAAYCSLSIHGFGEWGQGWETAWPDTWHNTLGPKGNRRCA